MTFFLHTIPIISTVFLYLSAYVFIPASSVCTRSENSVLGPSPCRLGIRPFFNYCHYPSVVYFILCIASSALTSACNYPENNLFLQCMQYIFTIQTHTMCIMYKCARVYVSTTGLRFPPVNPATNVQNPLAFPSSHTPRVS